MQKWRRRSTTRRKLEQETYNIVFLCSSLNMVRPVERVDRGDDFWSISWAYKEIRREKHVHSFVIYVI
jgi:hypothetical protein